MNQLEDYYNADRLRSVCLTFDTDWAPDFVLEELLEELQSFQLKSTIFATNPSTVLKDTGDVEIALHPNFMPGSTQGASIHKVLSTLKDWFPSAVGLRSHGLWQSSNLLRSLSQYGIVYDSNLLMYDLPCQQAFDTFYAIVRIPYIWSDASHLLAARPLTIDNLPLMSPGQKVLDIHPMLWYLNSATMENYEALKRRHQVLSDLTREQAAEFVNSGTGVRSLMRRLAEFIAERNIATYRLVDFYRVFKSQQDAEASPPESTTPFPFTSR